MYRCELSGIKRLLCSSTPSTVGGRIPKVTAGDEIEGKMLLKPQQDLCLNEDCRFCPLFSNNLFPPPRCRRAERSVTELALRQKAAKSSSHHFLMHQISFGHTGPLQFVKILERAIKTVHFTGIWKIIRCLGFVLSPRGTLQHSQP